MSHCNSHSTHFMTAFRFADTCCPFDVSRDDFSGTQEVNKNKNATYRTFIYTRKHNVILIITLHKRQVDKRHHSTWTISHFKMWKERMKSLLHFDAKTYQLLFRRKKIWYRPLSAGFFFISVWSDMKGSTIWGSGLSDLISNTLFSVPLNCGARCLLKVPLVQSHSAPPMTPQVRRRFWKDFYC